MKVAILGARGIGKYHARDFTRAGCEVIAILGRSPETADATASMLKEKFGLSVTPYHNVNELFGSENFDIVSICLPPELHEIHIKKSLDEGKHVFCEKPFLCGPNAHKGAKALFDYANSRKVLLSANMQWALFPTYISFDPVHSFQATMEPAQKGVGQLLDQLCHATSVLQKLVPNGRIENISVDKKSENTNSISFDYASNLGLCSVRYTFNFKQEQPRAVIFTVNGDEYSRKIGEQYQQSFVCKGKEIPIDDPFTESVAHFVEAVQHRGSTILTEEEILHNISVQEAIIDVYTRITL